MRLLSAGMATPLGSSKEAPAEIVYIPEGVHDITPSVDGEPGRVTVKVPPDQGKAIAARLQASLVERLAGPVRPHLDFDHAHTGPAAGIPTAFRYEEGKGIILALDWSARGRSAIEGKDYSYFSPEFLLGEDGTPHGLPEKGPIGTLVNEPAFRTIPRIAAADSPQPSNPTPTPMNPLVTCRLLTASEAALPEADKTAADRVQALKDAAAPGDEKDKRIKALEDENAALKKEKDDKEVAAKNAAEERAKNLVAAAVTDGRLLPADEAKKESFIKAIAAGNTFAEEQLAGLPKNGGPSGQVIAAGSTPANTNGVTRIQAAQSKARTELGSAADFEAVWERAQQLDPTAFND